MVFDVQTPTWQSHFGIAKAHNVATLGVFLERALNGAKAAPLHFDTGPAGMAFQTKPDGRVLVEFRYRDSSERLALSRLQLYEIEILTRYVLFRSFEPENGETQAVPRDNAVTSATS